MMRVKTNFKEPLVYSKDDFEQVDGCYYVTSSKEPVAYSTMLSLKTLCLLEEHYKSLFNIAQAINDNLIDATNEQVRVLEILLSYGEEHINCSPQTNITIPERILINQLTFRHPASNWCRSNKN